jgi:CheY-like chemotaxis protein
MTARPAHAILIVDDQSWNRELMAELLRGGGYRPLTAAGGEEAFEIARLERPSVVITDVLMPGVNGFELSRRLRAEAELGDTPIVFWTADYDDREVREVATALDVAGVLPKPCDLKGVLEMVAGAIAGATPGARREPAGDFDRTRACSATSSSRWRARSTARTSTCARATSASACCSRTSPAPSTGAHSTPT